MKIFRKENDSNRVEVLRNKRRGLKLLVRGDGPDFLCQYNCYLWNNPLCNKKPCGKVELLGSYHFVKDQ